MIVKMFFTQEEIEAALGEYAGHRVQAGTQYSFVNEFSEGGVSFELNANGKVEATAEVEVIDREKK